MAEQFTKQGHSVDELVYHARWFPLGPIVAAVMGLVIVFGQDLQAVTSGQWYRLAISYMSLPVFLGMFAYYKIRYRTHVIPLDQIKLK